jgi:hypothetical protein
MGRHSQRLLQRAGTVIPRRLDTVLGMQQRTFTASPMPVLRPGLRSRLILPAAVAELRAALEARVAQAPDDIAARVSLGELNLSVSLAASARANRREDETATRGQDSISSPTSDLLRARHVVPELALMARRR